MNESEKNAEKDGLPLDDEEAGVFSEEEHAPFESFESGPEDAEELDTEAAGPSRTPDSSANADAPAGLPAEQEKPASHAGPPAMRVAGILLPDGKLQYFDTRDLSLAVGDHVVVDNERDLNLGRVAFMIPNKKQRALPPILRKIGLEDQMLIRRNQKREEEAYQIGMKKISEHKLPMKLMKVFYLHGLNKAVFVFSAEGRVDFRSLVRDLAQELHVRIEMRQIGVRDEAKMLGGIGICGQQLCCSRFLRKFVPVSIKMAKNQGLALNPQKVSGVCGRLMCCLLYEDDVYRQLHKDFPKVGKSIETSQGTGKVIDVDVLGGKLRVLFDEERVVIFTLEELRNPKPTPAPVLASASVPAPASEPASASASEPASVPVPAATVEQQPGSAKGNISERLAQERSQQRGGASREAVREAGRRSAPRQDQGAAPSSTGSPGERRGGRSRRRSRRRRRPGSGGGGTPPPGRTGGSSGSPGGESKPK